MIAMCAVLLGSSPLTRGKHLADVLTRITSRLIPAHAGKTQEPEPDQDRGGAHPRSRGENRRSDGDLSTLGGSSPLTRGKPGVFLRA